ncbi:hypothetical protein DPMN_146760, partial [Dreissena polymorpha]
MRALAGNRSHGGPPRSRWTTAALVVRGEIQTVHLYNVVVAHVFHREPPRPWWYTAIAVVHCEINFLITPRLTLQFTTVKISCSTVYRGEIVIVHSGLNHGDEWWMAEIVLDEVVYDDWITLPPKRQPSYLDWKLNNQRSPISSSPRTPPPLAASPIQERTVSPNDLSRYDWFVGLMERGKATQLMQTVPDSTYLVRESANSARTGNPALTIKYKGDVRHIKIEYERSNGYYMSDARFFHSLPELIEFYQKNSLADSFQEVNTTLMYPYKTVSKGAGGAPTPYPVPLPPKPHAYVN